MRCRFLFAILLSACAAAQRPEPTTPRAQGPWVPEARARLGHVTDDALADMDAELERLRAIAKFELETEDPDPRALAVLLRMHRFDVERSRGTGDEAAALRRASASEAVLAAALPVLGVSAFETIVTLAPRMLISREREVLAFLRSGGRVSRHDRSCPSALGFYFDALTLSIVCATDLGAELAPLWSELSPAMRLALRARGVVPANDAITQAEANDLVADSFWGAQALLAERMLAGDLEPAQVLARSLAARDRANMPARLMVLAHQEIWAHKLPREALPILLTPLGPAELAHRFPDSIVAKLALMEPLAEAGLREDFERLRDVLPDSALALVAPAIPLLDARVRRDGGGCEEALTALLAAESKTVRAYAIARAPLPEDPRRVEPGRRTPRAEDAEHVLALDPPAWATWWRNQSSIPREVLARYVERLPEGPSRRRDERAATCFAREEPLVSCLARGVPLDANMSPEALDDTTLRDLARTLWWDAPKLEALFERYDGTAVAARAGYVYLRIEGLVRAGAVEEARARLATDGRVLSRQEHLFLDALLYDEAHGVSGSTPPWLGELEEIARQLLVASNGCPVPQSATDASDHDAQSPEAPLVLRISRAFSDDHANGPRMAQLLTLLEGRARQTLAAYAAMFALLDRDRAAFEHALAAGSFASDTRLAHAFMRIAANTFPTAPRVAANDPSLDFLAYEEDEYRRPESAPDMSGADVPEGDVDSLPRALADAYERFEASGDARAFLSSRATDENARRVQCDVAIEAIDYFSLLPGSFGVPRARDDEAAISRLRTVCEGARLTARARERYTELLDALSPATPATSVGNLTGSVLIGDEDRMAWYALAALTERPPNFVLARLAGTSEVLSLAIEGRAADARRAAQRDPFEAKRLAWLTEDLTARRIDERGARALLWLDAQLREQMLALLRSPDDARTFDLPFGMLTVLDAYPRAKLVASITARAARPVNPEESSVLTRADALLAAAADEVDILLDLEAVFDHASRRALAARALARARALDPRAEPRRYQTEPCDADGRPLTARP